MFLSSDWPSCPNCRPSNSFSMDFFVVLQIIVGPIGLRWKDIRKGCLGTPGNESQPSELRVTAAQSVPSPAGCHPIGADRSRQCWAQLSVHQQSQTQQVQGPTWEPGQEQKETGPNASNNRGAKSFLETGPKASLKTSTPATKLKGLSLSLNGLLGGCGGGSRWASSRPLRLITGNLSLRFCKAFNNSYVSICKIVSQGFCLQKKVQNQPSGFIIVDNHIPGM